MPQPDRGTIVVLNGPNLNLLGRRQPDIYGHTTLADVEDQCRDHARAHGFALDARQSNHEGTLIDWIHEIRLTCAGLIINPGGLTHTSVALRDAVVTVAAPVLEVHISNIHSREDFRHHSYISGIASGVIAGLGTHGYLAAIDHLARAVPRA
ncbi:type II 3-dehydroquinate dehydratase [Hoyosella sp. G463]|uniref:3-dehydroquinate dehydratase n=1 Tax=Lolliginicoccus lacisalsi TaxID=2742202 RepID=A0A927PLB8_9ACTN|nr:type II 3-dehydroquinate dehydratase [Lolliginicoccus lacisalsi]MBD8505684.1 type II 3-dehydroquinate dehydratase [Lolliginicoccus lacisalsi]